MTSRHGCTLIGPSVCSHGSVINSGATTECSCFAHSLSGRGYPLLVPAYVFSVGFEQPISVVPSPGQRLWTVRRGDGLARREGASYRATTREISPPKVACHARGGSTVSSGQRPKRTRSSLGIDRPIGSTRVDGRASLPAIRRTGYNPTWSFGAVSAPGARPAADDSVECLERFFDGHLQGESI